LGNYWFPLTHAFHCMITAGLQQSHMYWLMPISWHFRDCKVLLVTSLTHVSSTITIVQTFTFTQTTVRVSPTMHPKVFLRCIPFLLQPGFGDWLKMCWLAYPEARLE